MDGTPTTQTVQPQAAPAATPSTAPPAATDSAPVPQNMTATEAIEQAIVSYFVPKIHELLAPEPISLANLQKSSDYPAYRSYFLRFLREGSITMNDEEVFLKTIPAHIDSAGSRVIYDQIAVNPQEKQILAIVTGHNATNWQDVVAADIDRFLSLPKRKMPDYRTPVIFAELRRKFLSEIHDLASPVQFDQYIKSMDSLEEHLYGQRYYYYRGFELLRDESLGAAESVSASHTEATAPVEDKVYSESGPAPTLDPLTPTSHLSPISQEHIDQLMSHALIDGDPWRQAGQDYSLNIPSLASAGLAPKYQIDVSGQAVYLSNLFKLTSDQLAILAYIPAGGDVKVRGYYRDKNSALWRYLPDYVRELSGEGIGAFGIGFHERSTILPAAIQDACANIERNRGILDLSSTNPDFLFAGTAYAYNSVQEYRDALARGQLKGDFYREVESIANNADSASVIRAGRRKTAPQLLSINADLAPNFSQALVHYSAYSAFAGQVLGEAFPSEDRGTTWLFMSDYRGRNWVANIETSSPVGSTGCRREWLLPTDLATPLYESSKLADGYGDMDDVRAGNFLSMWNNYLAKAPLNLQYLEVLKRRG